MSIDYTLFTFSKPSKKKKEKQKYIKGHKHKQTKATEIPKKVKENVYSATNMFQLNAHVVILYHEVLEDWEYQKISIQVVQNATESKIMD